MRLQWGQRKSAPVDRHCSWCNDSVDTKSDGSKDLASLSHFNKFENDEQARPWRRWVSNTGFPAFTSINVFISECGSTSVYLAETKSCDIYLYIYLTASLHTH